jgi:hypothetical protein
MQLSVAAREKMGERSGPATRTLARVSTDQRLSISCSYGFDAPLQRAAQMNRPESCRRTYRDLCRPVQNRSVGIDVHSANELRESVRHLSDQSRTYVLGPS